MRQFTGGVGGDKFVVVTCRMGGGGARSPLALLDVRLAFHTANGDTPVLAVARGAPLPRFSAAVIYNGSGTLKGRWEVAMPGDPDPSERDLLTEATLPIEQRALQRRYTLIERFDLFLTPDGRTMINGPDPRRMPVQADGPYRVLLRIEASNDKEGDSNTGGGRVVRSGGVAGFPMPTLRYFVGSAQTLSRLGDAAKSASGGLALVLPVDGAMVPASARMLVSWIEIPNVALYRVEFMAGSETVFSALVRPGAGQYDAPSFLRERPEKALKWRVLSLARTGEVIAQSGFRTLRFE